MTKEEAREILQCLLDGVDPETGEILPGDHLVNSPDVIRALQQAVLAMSEPEESRWLRKNGRLNAARPWTQEDLEELAALYRDHTPMEVICAKIQRRKRGVEKQLQYMGLMDGEKKSAKKPQPGRDRAGQPWTQAEERLLRELHGKQQGMDEMAAELRRSTYAVFCHMGKLGLYGDVPGYPQRKQATMEPESVE